MTDPRGVAPYGYARGNPLSFNDPLGNGWFDGISNFFASVGAKVHDTFFPPEAPAVQPVDNSPSDASTAEYVAPQQPVQDTVDHAPVSSDIVDVNSIYTSDQQATYDPWSYLNDSSSLAAARQPVWAPAAADSAARSCGNSGVISQDGGGLISQDGGGFTGRIGPGY